MTNELTIGRLAYEAGVNVETIRYYQRRGLMAEPDKPTSGHRRYGPAAIKRVRFIKREQIDAEQVAEVLIRVALREAGTGSPAGQAGAQLRQLFSPER